MSTCWSLGRAAWLQSTPEPQNACLWRVHSLRWPHLCGFNSSLSGNHLFPLSVSSQSCGMGAVLGRQSREELWGSQPWQVPVCSSLQLPPPFCFLSLSRGCASCRNFSPSGWQPQQIPAWGGLAAMERAERQDDMGVFLPVYLAVHGDADPPLPPLPELTHGCYYSGKN